MVHKNTLFVEYPHKPSLCCFYIHLEIMTLLQYKNILKTLMSGAIKSEIDKLLVHCECSCINVVLCIVFFFYTCLCLLSVYQMIDDFEYDRTAFDDTCYSNYAQLYGYVNGIICI